VFVLEVGANDEYAANILTDNGYNVLGVDLLPHKLKEKCNYTRKVIDFCGADLERCFDCIFSLSAIEHFGLTTYGDKENDLPYYDVVAMHKMYSMLNHGGTCYITVPYGKYHLTHGVHWRVYNKESLRSRIVQKFKVEKICYFTSGSAIIGGVCRNPYQPVIEKEADRYSGYPPHVTVLLKMKK